MHQIENGVRRGAESARDHCHRREMAQHERPGRRSVSHQRRDLLPHRDGPLFKGKRVAVIGGGNSGVEAAIDLAGIVERYPGVRSGR